VNGTPGICSGDRCDDYQGWHSAAQLQHDLQPCRRDAWQLHGLARRLRCPSR
jgi:hypothetical protein